MHKSRKARESLTAMGLLGVIAVFALVGLTLLFVMKNGASGAATYQIKCFLAPENPNPPPGCLPLYETCVGEIGVTSICTCQCVVPS